MTEPRPTRGRMSRIQQLPRDLKDLIDELLRSGVSQKAILERIQPLCEAADVEPISQPSLNRYATRMAAEAERRRGGILGALHEIADRLEAIERLLRAKLDV